MLKELLNDWIFALTASAEVVEEDLDLDTYFTLANCIAWVSTVYTGLKGSCKTCEGANDCSRLKHFFFKFNTQSYPNHIYKRLQS